MKTIEAWKDELEALLKKYYNKHYSTLNERHWKVELREGKKYCKAFVNGSVFAFIEIETGNIYMPASVNKPAKHVRGNIKNSPASCCGPYGVNYLNSTSPGFEEESDG